VGTCAPATGVCSNPSSPDGIVCDDGSSCTTDDACASGVCSGTGPQEPGEVAADVLFQCASDYRITVGASRQRAALCFTRTDVAFFLHVERSQKVVRQQAVSKVSKRLASRELYPMALINTVADAVYSPPQLPDLRLLMGQVAWTCIGQQPVAASAAAR